MIRFADLIAGFLAMSALIVAIGAQNSFVLRQGLRREHVLPIVLFCAVSDVLLTAAGIAGLGAVLSSAPLAMHLVRYGGAAFLLVYGLLAARRALHAHGLALDSGRAISLRTALATCFAFTFLNPHVYLDTLVLLGALANRHGDPGRWVFGAGAAAASVIWFFGLGYGARLLAPVFANPLAWRVLDLLVALIMFGLAALLLFE